jgi:hypothetical protein
MYATPDEVVLQLANDKYSKRTISNAILEKAWALREEQMRNHHTSAKMNKKITKTEYFLRNRALANSLAEQELKKQADAALPKLLNRKQKQYPKVHAYCFYVFDSAGSPSVCFICWLLLVMRLFAIVCLLCIRFTSYLSSSWNQ